LVVLKLSEKLLGVDW